MFRNAIVAVRWLLWRTILERNKRQKSERVAFGIKEALEERSWAITVRPLGVRPVHESILCLFGLV